MQGAQSEPDPVLAALAGVADQVRDNIERGQLLLRRIEVIQELRGQGQLYRDMTLVGGSAEGDRPGGVVELVSQNLFGLVDAGARLRREMASALHAEGLTTTEIAALWGVSRQRVSALLTEANNSRAEQGATRNGEPAVRDRTL